MGRLSGRAQDGRAPRGTGHAVATERGRRQRRPPIRMRIRHGRSYRLPGHWKTFEMRCQLPKGRNAPVRQLETPNEIRDFWDWLTKSARDLPPRGDTARRLLEDGTEINLRQNSESGGPTIEVVTPGSGKNPKCTCRCRSSMIRPSCPRCSITHPPPRLHCQLPASAFTHRFLPPCLKHTPNLPEKQATPFADVRPAARAAGHLDATKKPRANPGLFRVD
jgi:hypothetical protein